MNLNHSKKYIKQVEWKLLCYCRFLKKPNYYFPSKSKKVLLKLR